eukprot:TRINITY_DN3949_c0_g4_i1.p1 TRINITY_DN3949_c0_g4~~TRINITY_DN3949_c0_g4_i1.p1  ORF type:complete len:1382 (+),score=514.86 TRINITY_DN3949_c0_g4_i1:385-4146(+)
MAAFQAASSTVAIRAWPPSPCKPPPPPPPRREAVPPPARELYPDELAQALSRLPLCSAEQSVAEIIDTDGDISRFQLESGRLALDFRRSGGGGAGESIGAVARLQWDADSRVLTAHDRSRGGWAMALSPGPRSDAALRAVLALARRAGVATGAVSARLPPPQSPVIRAALSPAPPAPTPAPEPAEEQQHTRRQPLGTFDVAGVWAGGGAPGVVAVEGSGATVSARDGGAVVAVSFTHAVCAPDAPVQPGGSAALLGRWDSGTHGLCVTGGAGGLVVEHVGRGPATTAALRIGDVSPVPPRGFDADAVAELPAGTLWLRVSGPTSLQVAFQPKEGAQQVSLAVARRLSHGPELLAAPGAPPALLGDRTLLWASSCGDFPPASSFRFVVAEGAADLSGSRVSGRGWSLQLETPRPRLTALLPSTPLPPLQLPVALVFSHPVAAPAELLTATRRGAASGQYAKQQRGVLDGAEGAVRAAAARGDDARVVALAEELVEVRSRLGDVPLAVVPREEAAALLRRRAPGVARRVLAAASAVPPPAFCVWVVPAAPWREGTYDVSAGDGIATCAGPRRTVAGRSLPLRVLPPAEVAAVSVQAALRGHLARRSLASRALLPSGGIALRGLPPFLRVGDFARMIAAVTHRRHTRRRASVTVAVRSEPGGAVRHPCGVEATLEQSGRRSLTFVVDAAEQAAGGVSVEAGVLADRETAEVVIASLDVEQPTREVDVVVCGELAAESSAMHALSPHPDSLRAPGRGAPSEGWGGVDLYAGGIGVAARPAFLRLAAAETPCVVDTAAVVATACGLLVAPSCAATAAECRAAAEAGLRRLRKLRCDSGAYAEWPGGDASPAGTALAALSFAHAAAADLCGAPELRAAAEATARLCCPALPTAGGDATASERSAAAVACAAFGVAAEGGGRAAATEYADLCTRAAARCAGGSLESLSADSTVGLAEVARVAAGLRMSAAAAARGAADARAVQVLAAAADAARRQLQGRVRLLMASGAAAEPPRGIAACLRELRGDDDAAAFCRAQLLRLQRGSGGWGTAEDDGEAVSALCSLSAAGKEPSVRAWIGGAHLSGPGSVGLDEVVTGSMSAGTSAVVSSSGKTWYCLRLRCVPLSPPPPIHGPVAVRRLYAGAGVSESAPGLYRAVLGGSVVCSVCVGASDARDLRVTEEVAAGMQVVAVSAPPPFAVVRRGRGRITAYAPAAPHGAVLTLKLAAVAEGSFIAPPAEVVSLRAGPSSASTTPHVTFAVTAAQ